MCPLLETIQLLNKVEIANFVKKLPPETGVKSCVLTMHKPLASTSMVGTSGLTESLPGWKEGRQNILGKYLFCVVLPTLM